MELFSEFTPKADSFIQTLILKKLWHILRLLLYGWILYIIFLVKWFRTWFRKWKRDKKQGQYQKNCNCNSVQTTVYKRPDPFIYDQYYMMQQHISGITWDNPDIKIYPKGTTGQPFSLPLGPPLIPSQLAPATEYLVAAGIYNYSKDAVALGVGVQFSYLSFGIGTISHAIPGPMPVIHVGVNGDSEHCPAYAYTQWTTPSKPGHYCIQVKIDCKDDMNPNNNLGQLNTHVVAAQSPANFSFLLRNPDRKRHTYHFKSDAYAFPKKDPCTTSQRKENPAAQREMQIEYARARNNVALFPVPSGWSVQIDPADNSLEAGEEKTIQASITPPDSFTGKQPINIHAFTEKNELAGGITVYITRQ